MSLIKSFLEEYEESITTPSKKYVKFEIPKSNVLLETKDRLLVLLDKNRDDVIWVSKKIAKNFNEYKLSFFVSYCLELYKNEEPSISVFNSKIYDSNNKMDVIDNIHPTMLELYFRKIG